MLQLKEYFLFVNIEFLREFSFEPFKKKRSNNVVSNCVLADRSLDQFILSIGIKPLIRFFLSTV